MVDLSFLSSPLVVFYLCRHTFLFPLLLSFRCLSFFFVASVFCGGFGFLFNFQCRVARFLVFFTIVGYGGFGFFIYFERLPWWVCRLLSLLTFLGCGGIGFLFHSVRWVSTFSHHQGIMADLGLFFYFQCWPWWVHRLLSLMEFWVMWLV